MSSRWYDPRIPAPEDCVLRPLLDRRARETPDKVFAVFAATDQTWTYAELLRATQETAAALAAKGVNQGDTVLTWLPNGPDALRVWFAVNYLGAIYVPLNLAYRGKLLEHAVRSSGARLDRGPPGPPAAPRRDRHRAARAEGGARRSGRPAPPGRPTAGSGARDHAVGHAVGDLHLGHDRPVQGRAVLVPAGRFGRACLLRRRLERPEPGQPAAVPCRRHRRDLPHAGQGRVDRPGGSLRHQQLLGCHAPHAIDLPHPARARWCRSCSRRRRRRATATIR